MLGACHWLVGSVHGGLAATDLRQLAEGLGRLPVVLHPQLVQPPQGRPPGRRRRRRQPRRKIRIKVLRHVQQLGAAPLGLQPASAQQLCSCKGLGLRVCPC